MTRWGHRDGLICSAGTGNFADVEQIRLALKSLAVRNAAENVTDEQLAELQSLIERMAGVLNDRDAYHSLNARFHDLSTPRPEAIASSNSSGNYGTASTPICGLCAADR